MADYRITTGKMDSETGDFVETNDNISIPGAGVGANPTFESPKVDEINYGELDAHPTDIPSGHVAVYVLKSDGNVYKKPSGGPETQIGGSGALSDSGSDNADGGDQYQLPQAEDSLDLQGQGGIKNAAQIDATILQSRSLPTFVRVFKTTNGDAVAVARDDDTILDSGSNHAEVIQSAIDYLSSSVGTTTYNRQQIGGWIDGGYETFTCSTGITIPSYIGFRNFDLNANGNTGFDILTLSDSSGNCHNPILKNVTTRNSGDSAGFHFDAVGWGYFENVRALGNGGNGFTIQAGSGIRVIRPISINNGGDGVSLIDNSSSVVTLCQMMFGDFANNGGFGFDVGTPNGSGEKHEGNYVAFCDAAGNTDDPFRVAWDTHGLEFYGNWIEGSGSFNIGPGGNVRDIYLVKNRVGAGSIDIKNCTRTFVRKNYPFRNGSFDITVQGGATDTLVEYNDLQGGTWTDNGTNTVRHTFTNPG